MNAPWLLERLFLNVLGNDDDRWAAPSNRKADGAIDHVRKLGRVRDLFAELERSENLLNVLDTARDAEGVRLFIGSENPLFSLSGSAMIVAPYMNAERKIVGALGVIGPTRLNYARVIPMVDYTAQVVGRLLGDPRGKRE